MIDADASCGNTFKTSTLLREYGNCRTLVNNEAIFKTNLRGVGDNRRTFSTSPITATSLTVKDDIVGLSNREARNLMTAVYSEEESSMNVNDGFYGKPPVGSLVFAWRANADGPIKELIEEISSKTQNDKVFVFLAASLFGGTGASGLPAIATAIFNHAANKENLYMTASLMLPYFKYEGEPQEKIDYTNFAVNSQNAISYYQKQMEKGLFNQVYMIGDPGKQDANGKSSGGLVRGAYSTQGGTQLNMPHIFELFAAAQAKKFFDMDETSIPNRNKTKWYADPYHLKGNSLNELVWEDYSDGAVLQQTIEDFMLFNYYFSMFIVPYIFDFVGNIGNYFELRPIGEEESFETPDWMHDGGNLAYHEMVSQGLMGLLGRKRKFTGWREDNIARASFETLYEYLTKSASWYFDLIHEYNEDSKNCDTCTSLDCSSNFSGTLRQCIQARVIFPGLFGSSGAWMIARRANFTKWLMKLADGKAATFQVESMIFIDEISSNALLNAVDDPRFGHPEGFNSPRMNLGGHHTSDGIFTALAGSIYEIVAGLRR